MVWVNLLYVYLFNVHLCAPNVKFFIFVFKLGKRIFRKPKTQQSKLKFYLSIVFSFLGNMGTTLCARYVDVVLLAADRSSSVPSRTKKDTSKGKIKA